LISIYYYLFTIGYCICSPANSLITILKITKAGMILKTQQIVKYKDDLFFLKVTVWHSHFIQHLFVAGRKNGKKLF